MSTPITSALVVCVAAAGIAAGALFLEAGDDSPAAPPASTAAPAADNASSNRGGGAYGDAPNGGDDGNGADNAGGNAGAPASAAMTISGFQFSSVEVAAGGQVTVTNQDSAPHTVTSDDGAFDTGNIGGGSSTTFTAPSQPGTYQFHCNIHSGMSGTLTVR
jgi:plastocyanin